MFISSDERVKECICPLKDLLPKLDKINFVSYDRIDKQTGNCDAGIIAQELAQVFPKMVYVRDDYLPNIQQEAEYTLTEEDNVSIKLINTIPLKEKDTILCIITGALGKEYYRATIMHATDVSITINKWINYNPDDKLFLHGTRVDDYHRVDIGQIGVLGAACAKELYHMVKCQAETIATLQAANAATSSQLAALKKQIDDLSARLS